MEKKSAGRGKPRGSPSTDIQIKSKDTQIDSRKPWNVQCTQYLSNSVTIEWDAPKCATNAIQHYEMKYKAKSEKQWKTLTTAGTLTSYVVQDLNSRTSYEFKLRAIFADNEDEEGPFSDICSDIETGQSLSEHILREAEKITDDKQLRHKLNLTETSVNETSKTRRCVFKNGQDHYITGEKTIMVVGATGSGKSTLIDGMVNFVLDVRWEDKWRFTIIDLKEEEKQNKGDESKSQTEWITCYTIEQRHGSKISYNLNIIDTPGFGDTMGIQKDKAIVEQIKTFFSTSPPLGIDTLDAVCFVAQAPLGRLTTSQKYIFDSILAIFGTNMKDNIFVLITFADGDIPPVKCALEAAKVPFQKAFKFNNSALFVSTENQDEFCKLFWKMGNDSFNQFFLYLLKTERKSLQLTSEVLKLRENLEVTIQGLIPQINEGLHVINTIKQEKRIIDQHKAKIMANKEFEYEVVEIHQKKEDLDPEEYVTNCLICNRTCHFPCMIPNDDEKRNCKAMNGTDNCTVCPQKCIWSQHCNNPYRFITYPRKVTKTAEDLKKKYDIAVGKEREHSTYLQNIKNEFLEVWKNVFSMIKQARLYINELNQKALRQNPLSQVQYIELLIKAEKSEAQFGWQKRIDVLETFKMKAVLMGKIPNEEFIPWTDTEVDDLLKDHEENKSSDAPYPIRSTFQRDSINPGKGTH